jgi:hypothetical protein
MHFCHYCKPTQLDVAGPAFWPVNHVDCTPVTCAATWTHYHTRTTRVTTLNGAHCSCKAVSSCVHLRSDHRSNHSQVFVQAGPLRGQAATHHLSTIVLRWRVHSNRQAARKLRSSYLCCGLRTAAGAALSRVEAFISTESNNKGWLKPKIRCAAEGSSCPCC